MSTTASSLPPGFERLEPFAANWAISGVANRAHRRDESTPEERAAFYGAAKDLAAAALDYLDKKPLSALDAQERRLRDLMLSLVHVAIAIEMQGDAEAGHAKLRRELPVTHAPADTPA